MTLRYLEDVITSPLPPLPAVVGEGILGENHALILFGQPKANKSMLVKQLAFCLVTGRPWLGFATTKKKVLYIQAEISPQQLEVRLRKMRQNVPPVDPRTLATLTNFKLKIDTPQGRTDLFKYIGEAKAEVIILDPLYRLISSQEEKSIQAAIDVCDELKEAKKTIVVVHHARKAVRAQDGIDLGGNELRGPLLEMWADSILQIKHGAMVNEARVKVCGFEDSA